MRHKALPESHREIFGRGIDPAQPLNVVVQVLVVAGLDDLLARHPVNFIQIDQHARFGLGRPAQSHAHRVVVAVPVEIVALAEDFVVALGFPVGIVEPVGRGESEFARDFENGFGHCRSGLQADVYSAANNSTSKISVEFGGIGPIPRSP